MIRVADTLLRGGQPSEKGGDGEEPLVNGVDGEPEQLEREGAEDRATPCRASAKGCRVPLFAQANANVTESVHHAGRWPA